MASSVVTTTAPASTSARSPERDPITSDIIAVGIAAMITTVWNTSPLELERPRRLRGRARPRPEPHDHEIAHLAPDPGEPAQLDHQPRVEHGEGQDRRAEHLEGALDGPGQVARPRLTTRPATSPQFGGSRRRARPREPGCRGSRSGRTVGSGDRHGRRPGDDPGAEASYITAAGSENPARRRRSGGARRTRCCPRRSPRSAPRRAAAPSPAPASRPSRAREGRGPRRGRRSGPGATSR